MSRYRVDGGGLFPEVHHEREKRQRLSMATREVLTRHEQEKTHPLVMMVGQPLKKVLESFGTLILGDTQKLTG